MSDQCKVEVAWGDDPYDTTQTWVDVSADVLRVEASTSTRSSEFDAFSAGTAQIVLQDFDRDYDPTYASSPYVNDFVWGTQVRVRSVSPAETVWHGWVTRFQPAKATGRQTTTITAMDGLGLLAEWNIPVAAAAGEGDLPDGRIGDVADTANWPSGWRDLDASGSDLQSTTYSKTALALMIEAARSNAGLIYHCPHSGNLVYEHREAVATRTRTANVQASFGGVGELGIVDGSLELAAVGDGFRNIVKVTAAGGSTVKTAGSVTSTQAEKAVAVSVPLLYQSDAQTLADFWFDLFSQETAHPYRWSTMAYLGTDAVNANVLSVRCRDRVNVEWDLGPGGAENDDVLVNGIRHQIDAGRWLVSFTAEAAAPYDALDGPPTSWLLLDDVTKGQLNQEVLGY